MSIPARTRLEQAENLARYYERNHEGESALLIRYLLAELAQRDQMLSESIDRQIWLEQCVEAMQRGRTQMQAKPVQFCPDTIAAKKRAILSGGWP